MASDAAAGRTAARDEAAAAAAGRAGPSPARAGPGPARLARPGPRDRAAVVVDLGTGNNTQLDLAILN